MEFQSAKEALSSIKSNQRIFLHGSAATPLHLMHALFENSHGLKNIEFVSLSTLGDGIFDHPEFGKSFFMNSLFVSDNVRGIVNTEHGDYVPVFLSEISQLFEKMNFWAKKPPKCPLQPQLSHF